MEHPFLQITPTVTINLDTVTTIDLYGPATAGWLTSIKFWHGQEEYEIVLADAPNFRGLVKHFFPNTAAKLWGGEPTIAEKLANAEVDRNSADRASGDMGRQLLELHAVLAPSVNESLLKRAKDVMALLDLLNRENATLKQKNDAHRGVTKALLGGADDGEYPDPPADPEDPMPEPTRR